MRKMFANLFFRTSKASRGIPPKTLPSADNSHPETKISSPDTGIPVCHFIWVGPPSPLSEEKSAEGIPGHDIDGVVKFAKSAENPVEFFCLNEHKVYYETRFKEAGVSHIKVKTIEDLIAGLDQSSSKFLRANAQKIQSIVKTYLSRGTKRDLVSVKNLVSLLTTYMGGFTMDTNVMPIKEEKFRLQRYNGFLAPYINGQTDIWLMHAPPRNKDVRSFIKHFLEEWDEAQQTQFDSVSGHTLQDHLLVIPIHSFVYTKKRTDKNYPWVFDEHDGSVVMENMNLKKIYMNSHKHPEMLVDIISKSIQRGSNGYLDRLNLSGKIGEECIIEAINKEKKTVLSHLLGRKELQHIPTCFRVMLNGIIENSSLSDRFISEIKEDKNILETKAIASQRRNQYGTPKSLSQDFTDACSRQDFYTIAEYLCYFHGEDAEIDQFKLNSSQLMEKDSKGLTIWDYVFDKYYFPDVSDSRISVVIRYLCSFPEVRLEQNPNPLIKLITTRWEDKPIFIEEITKFAKFFSISSDSILFILKNFSEDLHTPLLTYFIQNTSNKSKELEVIPFLDGFRQNSFDKLSITQKDNLLKFYDNFSPSLKEEKDITNITYDVINIKKRIIKNQKHQLLKIAKGCALNLSTHPLLCPADSREELRKFFIWYRHHIEVDPKDASYSKIYEQIIRVKVPEAREMLYKEYIDLIYKEAEYHTNKKIETTGEKSGQQVTIQDFKDSTLKFILKIAKNSFCNDKGFSLVRQGYHLNFFNPPGTIEFILNNQRNYDSIISEIKKNIGNFRRGFFRSEQTKAFYELILTIDRFITTSTPKNLSQFESVLDELSQNFHSNHGLTLSSNTMPALSSLLNL